MSESDRAGYVHRANRVESGRGIGWIVLAAVAFLMAGCGGGEKGESGTAADDLDLPGIGRETAKAPVSDEPRILPNGLAEKTWSVPPTFLTSTGGGGGGAAAVDPFAAPSGGSGGSGVQQRQTARGTLENYGVTFQEQAGAIYDPIKGTLTVTASPDQLDLVDAIMESLQDGIEKNMGFRLEIYQLPALLALKLEQSAESHADNTPEWAAVQRLLEKGEVRFVTSAQLTARSGQRALFEDISEHIYIADYVWANPEKKERLVPSFETRHVGLIFEIDPVLGPDSTIIDINLSPEYHSAPPTEKMVSVRFPGMDEVVEMPMPEFHVKKITTQLTMADGHTKLLSAWRPTGKPEYEKADLMLIMFLSADVQPVYDIGPAGQ